MLLNAGTGSHSLIREGLSLVKEKGRWGNEALPLWSIHGAESHKEGQRAVGAHSHIPEPA